MLEIGRVLYIEHCQVSYWVLTFPMPHHYGLGLFRNKDASFVIRSCKNL